jgi:tetratricopeptide (TPR) repeat protein
MEQVAKIVYGEAIKFAEERLNVNAADVEALSSIAYYYSKIGQSEKAIKMNASALANSPDDMYVNYNAALIYAQLGDRDRALVALERAVELDYQPELLSTDPGFSSLREEERFQRLVAKNNP